MAEIYPKNSSLHFNWPLAQNADGLSSSNPHRLKRGPKMEKPCYSCPKGLMDGYITIFLDKFCRYQCFQNYGGCPSSFNREVMNIHLVIQMIREALEKNAKARIFLDAPNFLDVPGRRRLPDEEDNQHIEILKEIIKREIKPYLRIETTVCSLAGAPVSFYEFLREAGVQEVWMGVESGSLELRNKYEKPYFTNNQLVEITGAQGRAGIRCGWYLVVGFEDSDESIQETIDLIS
ncbi:MAG TPA: hypothetical protein VK254_03065, partial [Candidatus Bathyarchaeia archaeon]|nr:hypothetical protein [Candidatus Bathyarchaeia archaeon]